MTDRYFEHAIDVLQRAKNEAEDDIHCTLYATEIDMILDLLKEQPEIVRCIDCKHKEKSVSPYWRLWCKRLHSGCDPDWFCADGERNDGL